MSRFVVRVLSVLVLLIGAAALRAATPKEVDAAIKKGVDWLYKQQNANGHWEAAEQPDKDWRKMHSKPEGAQFGGYTSIATYALLDAGESWRDPRMKNAIEWLYRAPLVGTYAVALRAQVWQYLPQNNLVKTAAQRDCNMLLSGMKAKGDSRGFWSYLIADHATPRYDHSCSQIALLGIWACQQAGRDVPLAFWKEAENAWRSHQADDGSWSYIHKAQGEHGQPKLSMTLAGVATLFITQDYVHANDGLACRGNLWDDRLVKGTRWIYQNIGGNQQMGAGYNMYSFERVAMASGFKYFGTFDWFKQGAEAVVRRQQADGSWGSIPETAFSLLFLSRGRAPVIVNKFEYELEGEPGKSIKAIPRTGPELLPDANQPAPPPAAGEPPKPDEKPKTFIGNWCQRPRDIAAFSKWMSSVVERRLNWQIINNNVSVDDFHDAPVLYIAGNQKLVLPKETLAKLRQYIEEGGVIFANADCSNADFSKSFEDLGTQLFPKYEFRDLPANHPIYTLQIYKRGLWKTPPPVRAMSNGARELMIISPANDLARWWSMGGYAGHEDSYQLFCNIILYAADRSNLKYKGATHVVRPNAEPATEQTRKISVARFNYKGNSDPEPAGWRRLTAILHNQKQAELKVEPFPLGENKANPEIHTIAHLTGTAAQTLTKEEIAELRKFIVRGGTILCDATGGNSEFAESMEKQLAALIAGAKFEPIPINDPILAPIAGTTATTDPLLANVTPGQNAFAGASTQPTTGPTTAPSDSPATQPATPPTEITRKPLGLLPTTGPSTAPATQPDASADTQPSTLPASHLLVNGGPIEYRKFARSRMGSTQNLRLKGIKFRNKWVVIFSAEDLSTGMVGQQIDGINGYTPACATEIMRRLVLNIAPKPAAPPAP